MPRTRRPNDELAPAFPGQWRGGRGRTKWSYGYKELAALFGVEVNTVRQWASAGKFDPTSLGSVVAFYLKRKR